MEQPELTVSEVLETLSRLPELRELTLRCDPHRDPVYLLNCILRVLYVHRAMLSDSSRQEPTVITGQALSPERQDRFYRLLHAEPATSSRQQFQPEAFVSTVELSPSQVERFKRLKEGAQCLV